MKYIISFEDALDHGTTADTFETLEEAQVAFKKYVEDGPDGYDIGVELIVEDDDEDWETLEYHEWFTQESWREAHPSGYPD